MSKFDISEYPVKLPSKKEYAAVFITENGLPFKNALIGITYPNPDYRINRSSSNPVNVFEYVIEGEGEILLDGEWKTVKAGSVYLLRAGEAHK